MEQVRVIKVYRTTSAEPLIVEYVYTLTRRFISTDFIGDDVI